MASSKGERQSGEDLVSAITSVNVQTGPDLQIIASGDVNPHWLKYGYCN